MRLFLAIKPDRAAEALLGQALLRIQSVVGPAAAALKWTPASNIHATLHFLGEVNAARTDRLIEIMRPALREAPFTVSLGGAGAFPPTGGPRVVWLDVTEGAEGLVNVHAELGIRLSEAGFAVEPRPFTPHLTVARVRDRDRSQVKGLRERLTQVQPVDVSWFVDRVLLFRSDLSGAVPRYEDINATPLRAPLTMTSDDE